MKKTATRMTLGILAMAVLVMLGGLRPMIADAASIIKDGKWMYGFTVKHIPFGRGDSRGSCDTDSTFNYTKSTHTLAVSNVTVSGTLSAGSGLVATSPAADDTTSLGDASHEWKNGYIAESIYNLTHEFTFPSAGGVFVTTAGTQTLTNKTLTSPAMTGATTDTLTASKTVANSAIVAVGNSGNSKTVDFTAGNTQSITATGAPCTLTFTAPAGPSRLVLVITQGSGGTKTFTWPAAVKWAGGSAPTLTTTAAHIDIVGFEFDGTSYYGRVLVADAS